MNSIFKKAWTIFTKTVRAIEESPAPLWYFGFTFLAAITLRSFLEFFEGHHDQNRIAYILWELLTTNPAFSVGYVVIHYSLFYVSLGVMLILILRLVTSQPVVNLFKIVSTGFLVTTIVPIIDMFVSGSIGYRISYVIPTDYQDLFLKFITLFGFSYSDGVSPGIQTEIVIVLLFIFAYARLKGLTVVRSLLASLAVYTTIFIYFIFPFLANAAFGSFFFVEQNSAAMVRALTIILIVALLGIGFKYRNIVKSIARDIRLPRLLHYWLMFGLGILLLVKMEAVHPFSFWFLEDAILLLMSIGAAWIYSVMTNNMEDIEIDRVSNPSRPLVSRHVDIKEYKQISWFVLAIALLTAAIVGPHALFLIVLFLGNYFMYSMPPLRIKRVLVFSKITIFINSFVIFLLGVAAFNEQTGTQTKEIALYLSEQVPALPLILLPFFVLIALNFLDLKDYEGDKRAGIKTLPVLIGMRRSQILIGIGVLCAYTCAGFLFKNNFILACAVSVGLVEFFLVVRRPYREVWVFIPYLISIAALFFII